jgi:hypothetical protein
MKTLSFFRTALAIIVTAAAYAFAAPAMAQDQSCTGYCPTPTTTFGFSINTGVAFGGEGFGSFGGQDGGVSILKQGFGITESSFTAAGSPCGTPDCANGSFSAMGAAGEQVKVDAFATGNNAWVKNGGSAATLLNFSVQKVVTPTGQ